MPTLPSIVPDTAEPRLPKVDKRPFIADSGDRQNAITQFTAIGFGLALKYTLTDGELVQMLNFYQTIVYGSKQFNVPVGIFDRHPSNVRSAINTYFPNGYALALWEIEDISSPTAIVATSERGHYELSATIGVVAVI